MTTKLSLDRWVQHATNNRGEGVAELYAWCRKNFGNDPLTDDSYGFNIYSEPSDLNDAPRYFIIIGSRVDPKVITKFILRWL